MLDTIEERVKCLLYKLPKARDNDMYLFCVYCWNFLGTTDLRDLKDNPTNIFESIRRTRQKIQASCPELMPSQKVKTARQSNYNKYKEYARD